MNEEASELFGAPSLAFYNSKGLVWSATGIAELASTVGCEEARLEKTLKQYGQGAAAAGEGGKEGVPADEDAHGKTVFPTKDWRLDQEFREFIVRLRTVSEPRCTEALWLVLCFVEVIDV